MQVGGLVHLRAGESRQIRAHLDDRYDFQPSGSGDYTLTVRPDFDVATPESLERFQTIRADVDNVRFHHDPAAAARGARRSIVNLRDGTSTSGTTDDPPSGDDHPSTTAPTRTFAPRYTWPPRPTGSLSSNCSDRDDILQQALSYAIPAVNATIEWVVLDVSSSRAISKARLMVADTSPVGL